MISNFILNIVMKKKQIIITVIIIALALIVCGGIAAFILLSEESEPIFTLYKEQGTVLFKKPNEDFQSLKEEKIVLPNNSVVKTEDGFAHILFPDNSMTSLDQYSEILVNISGNYRSIKQIIGNTWYRIQKLSSNQKFEVETPNTLATVRGTKFGTGSKEEESNVWVIEDKVNVSLLNKDKEQQESGNQTDLKVNQNAHISNNILEVTEIPEETTENYWFKRNMRIDVLYDKWILKITNDEFIEKIKEDEVLKHYLPSLKNEAENNNEPEEEQTPTPTSTPTTTTQRRTTIKPTINPTATPTPTITLPPVSDPIL